MANFLNKIINSMNSDEEFYDDEPIDDIDSFEEDSIPKKSRNEVRPIGRGRSLPSNMEVMIVKPTSYDDAKEITESLLNNKAIMLNLESIDSDNALRLLDFLFGAIYATGGHVQQVSQSNYVFTPKSVEISGNIMNEVSPSVGGSRPAGSISPVNSTPRRF